MDLSEAKKLAVNEKQMSVAEKAGFWEAETLRSGD